MRDSGAEAFRAAFKRSIRLIVALVLLGAAVVVGLRQWQGDRYSASTKVLVTPISLSQILTGTQPPFIDPQRNKVTAQALATSSAVYRLAADGKDLGTPRQLKSATSVSAATGDEILAFTAIAEEPQRAVAIVNAVAEAYSTFRGELSRSSVTRSANALQRTVDAWPGGVAPEQVLRQLNRLRVLQNLNASDAQVVDASVSATQTNPVPRRDALLGGVLGLVIALVAVALREAIDTKVRSDSIVEDVLDAPVIASIPSLPRGSRLVLYGRRERDFVDAYALLAAQLPPASARDRPYVVAVTSALANEGKTTTAANLAVALARRGPRVILADLDFRKRSLGDVFELPEEAGGALQVLDGSYPLNEALWTVSLEGRQPQVTRESDLLPELIDSRFLSLLSAGDAATGQGVISGGIGPLVRDLRRRADLVILDTPAALLTSDMAEVSRLVDSVLVVVRQGRTTRRTLRTLAKQSRTWDAGIVGVVLTDTEPEGAPYGPIASR